MTKLALRDQAPLAAVVVSAAFAVVGGGVDAHLFVLVHINIWQSFRSCLRLDMDGTLLAPLLNLSASIAILVQLRF